MNEGNVYIYTLTISTLNAKIFKSSIPKIWNNQKYIFQIMWWTKIHSFKKKVNIKNKAI